MQFFCGSDVLCYLYSLAQIKSKETLAVHGKDSFCGKEISLSENWLANQAWTVEVHIQKHSILLPSVIPFISCLENTWEKPLTIIISREYFLKCSWMFDNKASSSFRRLNNKWKIYYFCLKPLVGFAFPTDCGCWVPCWVRICSVLSHCCRTALYLAGGCWGLPAGSLQSSLVLTPWTTHKETNWPLVSNEGVGYFGLLTTGDWVSFLGIVTEVCVCGQKFLLTLASNWTVVSSPLWYLCCRPSLFQAGLVL